MFTIDQMIIELTRRCNMTCEHCLRGNAQNLNFDKTMLPNIFGNVRAVNSITFTGGEPTLALKQLEEIIDYIIFFDIEVGQFYIKINGRKFSPKLLKLLKKLQNCCTEPTLCFLDISQDQFHGNSFCEKSYSDLQDEYDFIKIGKERMIYNVIIEGKAKENGIPPIFGTSGYYQKSLHEPKFKSDWLLDEQNRFVGEMVYVSSNGNVITDCDLSFESVDKYSFGNVKNEDLLQIIRRHSKTEDEDIKDCYIIDLEVEE